MYIAASKLESKIMSDELKHECGIAMIRLLKPLEYYQKKYNTSLYALNKMYLLMQKQVNSYINPDIDSIRHLTLCIHIPNNF